MATAAHVLVEEYRQRLRAAAQRLPAEDAAELLAEIESHLADALHEGATEAEVRDALERLGEPEAIVAAAVGDAQVNAGTGRGFDGERHWTPGPTAGRAGWAPPPARPRSRLGALEIVAVVLLLAGGILLPLVGWIVGAVLMLASKAWPARTKVFAMLVVPGGLLPAVLMFVLPNSTVTCRGSASTTLVVPGGPASVEPGASTFSCTRTGLSPGVALTLQILLFLAPFVTTLVLLRTGDARRGSEAVTDRAEATTWAPVATGDERVWAIAAHLGVLIGLPLLVPFVIYLAKRDAPFARDQAAEALNFQLTIVLASILTIPLVIVFVGIPLLIALGVAALVLAVVAAAKANDGVAYRYPMTLRVVS